VYSGVVQRKKRWIDVIQENCKILGMTVHEAGRTAKTQKSGKRSNELLQRKKEDKEVS